MSLRLLIKNY